MGAVSTAIQHNILLGCAQFGKDTLTDRADGASQVTP